MNDLTPQQKANRQEWVKALRSGSYHQAQGALRIADCYCCLGVACDVYEPGDWHEQCHHAFTYGLKEDDSSLPDSVSSSLGMNAAQQSTAIALNDDKLLSFNEIADWVEAGMPEEWP